MEVLDYIGDPGKSEWTIIQPVDDHDREMLPREAALIREACPECSFAVIPVAVDWFRELSPWAAPAVFRGQPDFGSGAPETLERILREVLPGVGGRKILGGYSLAGLFALWAGYQTEAFAGIAAVSPSVWYPEWDAYAARNRCLAPAVYLSLGQQEEMTRNPVMRQVGDRIREQYRLLSEQGIRTVLEWNPGNHFKDPEGRTAAGVAWVMGGC